MRASDDFGATWATLDTFDQKSTMTPTEGYQDVAYSLAEDATGAVYVVGTSGLLWSVRKSTDQGQTWNTVDTYTSDTRTPNEATAIAVSSDGGLFVTGSDAASRWIIRKSTDGGSSWAIADLFISAGNPSGAAIDHGGNIFVTGVNTGSQTWITRVSTDGGATWKNVDEFTPTPSLEVETASVAVASDDSIYALGTYLADKLYNWTIRKSSDHGQTWSTIESHGCSTNTLPQSMTVTSDGQLWIAGMRSRSWFIQSSPDGGVSWTDRDVMPAGSFGSLEVFSIAHDQIGNLYAGGQSVDSGCSAGTWLVRRSTDGGKTWATVDQLSE